jgi:hydroxymethylglutaryl-CoA reductase
VVAAAAQDTTEGAVMAAAGVGAKILSEAAGAVGSIIGELLSDSNDFQRVDEVQLRGAGSSTGRCG